MKRMSLLALLLLAVAGLTTWGYEYFVVDACFDSGGIWDRADRICIRAAQP